MDFWRNKILIYPEKFDPNQITSLKQLSQKETELANLRKNSPDVSQGVGYNGTRRIVTPELEKLTNEVNSLKSQVSPEVLQNVYPSIANGSYDKYIADKALVDKANTYLANPALVNSLFGVQYLVILMIALLLRKLQAAQ